MKTLDNIWIYAETPEGKGVPESSLQLLTPASELALKSGALLTAVCVNASEAAIEELSCRGSRRIINILCPGLLYAESAEAIAHCAEKYRPDALIISATPEGRMLAPRISTLLNTGLTADCTGLSFCPEDGYIHFIRPALGGNVMAEIICRGNKPQMGTIRPNVFPLPEKRDNKVLIINESYDKKNTGGIKLIEAIQEASGERAELDRAEIIVAGGKGLGKAEGFELLRRLAELIGAELAASRAAVEAGWISHSHQVGQTGTAVSPKLYIACGISGAVQHLAGIVGAEHIIAINSDPEAPIFKYADLGITGDIYELIPEMIKKLESRGVNK